MQQKIKPQRKQTKQTKSSDGNENEKKSANEKKNISTEELSEGVQQLISQLKPESVKYEEKIVTDYLGPHGKKLIKHLKKAAKLDRGPDFSRTLRNVLRALILQFAQIFTQGYVTHQDLGTINDVINEWAVAVLHALNSDASLDEGSVGRTTVIKELTKKFIAVHDGIHRVLSPHLSSSAKLHPWLAGLKHLFDFYSASRFLDSLCFSPKFASEKKAIHSNLMHILQFRSAQSHNHEGHEHSSHCNHSYTETKKEKHTKEKSRKAYLIETVDGGVRKVRIVKDGEGWETAEEDWGVCIRYTARCGGWDSSVLQDGWPTDSVTITLGKLIQPAGVTEGLEEAIKMMKKGETSRFEVKPNYGYGEKGDKSLGVAANSTIYYEVGVISYTKPEKTMVQLRGQKKLAYAQGKKEEGNQCFKNKRYRRACEKYHLVLKCYDYEQRGSETDEDADEDSYPQRVDPTDIHSLQIICHSNLSMCYLRRKKYTTAIGHCDAVLNQESKEESNDSGVYTKLWFRRGQAWLYNADPEKALDDLTKAKSLTKDPAMIKKIEQFENAAKKRINKERKKQKKTYAGFFDKKKTDDKKEDEKETKDKKETKGVEKKELEDKNETLEDLEKKHLIEDGKQEDQEQE